ncbi:MAG TPA: hypothetical protein VL484_00875, partial [Vicinamibacterales bacterium]|nr:hypothetical protein [Vicinamibacterales bacterium]
HVEYAGIVPQLERLASRFGDDDLVIAESTNAGTDIHVLAVPLAYTYGRHVLLLVSPVPDKAMLCDFLDWARTRYRHVFFLGSGGTDVLSRRWSVEPVASEQFKVPEYQTTRWNDFPRFVKQKEFDYGVFEFEAPRPDAGDTFDLDVGVNDDLYVVRFQAKERTEGRTIRWTRYNSFLALKPFSGASRAVTIWMSSGGRPSAVPPAQVSVYLNARPGDATGSGEHLLGTVQVPTGFRMYTFDIPPEIAADAALADPPRLRIQTNTWNPHEALGSGDDRQLGVMIDRVQVR